MRSSSGVHYLAIDHLRALAAFMVFTWHFVHGPNGDLIPYDYVPSIFVFSILAQGHTGVALFMTLSGYLFAKLLDGKRIHYKEFLWNRFIRLAPLLIVVILLVGFGRLLDGEDLYKYLRSIAAGVLLSSLPNGGWSITIEFHFYILLPLLLFLSRKSKPSLFLIILAALALRSFMYHKQGQVLSITYYTIIGRLDQFLLGILAFQYRSLIANRHITALLTMIVFSFLYWWLLILTGFFQSPSSPFWIFFPTLEGFAYALAIAYYDSSFSPPDKGISRFIGQIGAYSYSLYLLHFFVVYSMAIFINEKVVFISNFYLSCVFACICFVLITPVGYLSYRFIESPFLKLRRHYLIENKAPERESP